MPTHTRVVDSDRTGVHDLLLSGGLLRIRCQWHNTRRISTKVYRTVELESLVPRTRANPRQVAELLAVCVGL